VYSFDSVPHDLLLKAVAHHTDERWVLLYIARWLKAPMQMPDGTIAAREKGTPQGSPISPLLANLFMHYAFDTWMVREFPGCPFERYADDIVAHCNSEGQARHLRAAIADRLRALGLELHPEKTKVVYCKDANRRGDSEHTSFDFLGYTFRGRLARGRKGFFVNFLPAISAQARKAKGQQIRAWHLNRRTGTDLSGIAKDINPQVRGWINYYGVFYHSELFSLMRRIDEHPRPMGHAQIQTIPGQARPGAEGAGCCAAAPAHPVRALATRLDHPTPVCGSRMTGDCQVRFYESGRGRFPPATHQKPGVAIRQS
jgi:group II intron reverse transcriptase/maturase